MTKAGVGTPIDNGIGNCPRGDKFVARGAMARPNRFAAIILAAGQGTRAERGMPKQYATHRGRPVLSHSVEAFFAAGADPVIVCVPPGDRQRAEAAVGLSAARVRWCEGGSTRQRSSANALAKLDSEAAPHVLIHDAARTDLPLAVIDRLLDALEEADGAVPVLPIVDSLLRAEGGRMVGRAEREELRRVQTPQAFRTSAIKAAYGAWTGEANAGDDAQVLHAAGGTIVMVEGDERLVKLTRARDFDEAPSPAPVRVGTGFDVHRLVAGKPLWLGGVLLDHHSGLSGHSDADVALHAITDALLGGIGAGDIGAHFPPSDPRWKGASSDRFVRHAGALVREAGYAPVHVDCTICCEAPKIGPYRDAMRAAIAKMLDIEPAAVSIKATTTEGLGFTGRGEGIAAQAVATLCRSER